MFLALVRIASAPLRKVSSLAFVLPAPGAFADTFLLSPSPIQYLFKVDLPV